MNQLAIIKPVALGATRQQSTGFQQNTYRGVLWHPSRTPLYPVVYSADREFIGARRQLAWNTALDLEQNFSTIGWMIRQDQVYTSQFGFQPRTPDVQYNRELRSWWDANTLANQIDVQRRLSFEDMMLTWNGLKVLMGYASILKISGGKFQVFEPWQMARGSGCEVDEAHYGVKINKNGLVLDDYGAIDWIAFATGDDSGSLKHRYLAYHDEVIIDGFTNRTADTLWESPLMSVLDKCRDSASSAEYQLMAQKLQAMFVVVRYMKPETKGGADFPTRQGTWGVPETDNDPAPIPSGSNQITARTIPQPPPLSEVRSGMMLNMEADEKVDFLTSKTPSPEFIASVKHFTKEILRVLDIPYSFLDSETANYSSMKADSVRYMNSCRPRMRKNAAAWREAIKHKLRAGIVADMPMWKGKYTVDNLPFALVPQAPWILDPSKEIPSKSAMVSAGWDDNEHVTESLTGRNFYDVVDAIAEQESYARAKGVTLNRGNISVKLTGNANEEEGTAPAGKKAAPVGAGVGEEL